MKFCHHHSSSCCLLLRPECICLLSYWLRVWKISFNNNCFLSRELVANNMTSTPLLPTTTNASATPNNRYRPPAGATSHPLPEDSSTSHPQQKKRRSVSFMRVIVLILLLLLGLVLIGSWYRLHMASSDEASGNRNRNGAADDDDGILFGKTREELEAYHSIQENLASSSTEEGNLQHGIMGKMNHGTEHHSHKADQQNDALMGRGSTAVNVASQFSQQNGADAAESTPIFISFVIPTVSRSTPYLTRTLEGLLQQLPSPRRSPHNPMVSSIRILVVNNNAPEKRNEEFEELKSNCNRDSHGSAHFSHSLRDKCANYVRFDALGQDKQQYLNKPGASMSSAAKVLQQTADMTEVFKRISAASSDQLSNSPLREIQSSQYVVFMEDDWILCPNAWQALLYLVSKVETQFSLDEWIGLRFSYGLNGILMQMRDVPQLANYFDDKLQAARSKLQRSKLPPPDHMIYDFMAMNHREHRRSIVVFRHNLFDHIGQVSSLMSRSRYNPGCYGYMYDWLQPLEIFNNEQCPEDDISPCPQQDPNAQLVDWDTTSRDLHRKHFPICDKSVRSESDAIAHACRLR